MSFVIVGSCDGAVGMSHLVLQHVVTVMVHLSILGVGSCDGVVGMRHLVLQHIVTVMVHFIHSWCGVL